MVRRTKVKTPLGDLLTNDKLVEMGDDRLGGRDEGEPFLLRGRFWWWGRFRLRGSLRDCLGGARAADAGSRLEAALKERDVVSEAEGAARSLVFGHGDTGVGGVMRPPRWRSDAPFGGVSLSAVRCC